jgi:hypothetical protein
MGIMIIKTMVRLDNKIAIARKTIVSVVTFNFINCRVESTLIP